MCQSSAYLENEGKSELLMEDVDLFEASGDQIRLVNIFGEEIEIKAKVKNLSLVDHKIILKSV
ncbi:MAG: CooT family nickel-binding protein [Deltaproteobacteria bacterium]|nr:CooT family nickel-binding protein [Deltaproteobacteria bacterium]